MKSTANSQATIFGIGSGINALLAQFLLTALTVSLTTNAGSSALDIGMLQACASLPYLIIGFHAGAIVDRVGPATVISKGMPLLAVSLMLVYFVTTRTAEPQIPLMFALAAMGIAMSFFLPAISAIPAKIFLGAEQQEAMISGFRWKTLGDLIGVGAAGLAFTLLGLDILLVASILTLVCMGLFRQLREQKISTESEARTVVTLNEALISGLRYAKSSRTIAALLGISIVLNLGQALAVPMLYPFLSKDLVLPAQYLTPIFGLPSLGMLAGVSVVRRFKLITKPTATMSFALLFASLLWILLAVTTQSVYVTACILFSFGLSMACAGLSSEIIRLERVDKNYYGRVASLGLFVSRLCMPVGAFAGGIIAVSFGTKSAFLVAGAVIGLATLLAIFVLPANETVEEN